MLINARSETILEKPSFRKAAITRRALIPAEGYLRMAEGRGREEDPYYLFSEKDDLLAFASLYEFWPDPSLPEDDPGKWLLSCTVLTTTAHATLGQIHDRAPISTLGDGVAADEGGNDGGVRHAEAGQPPDAEFGVYHGELVCGVSHAGGPDQVIRMYMLFRIASWNSESGLVGHTALPEGRHLALRFTR
jgi:hypothetical protein